MGNISSLQLVIIDDRCGQKWRYSAIENFRNARPNWIGRLDASSYFISTSLDVIAVTAKAVKIPAPKDITMGVGNGIIGNAKILIEPLGWLPSGVRSLYCKNY